MITHPMKRIYGLIGKPRSGKDEVARFLQENRGFTRMAFADKIKGEMGISPEDFEKAKITGEIDKLRQDLWDFSASKKKDDPLYFVKQVMQEAYDCSTSVIITDIRTMDEFDGFFEVQPTSCYMNNREMFKRTFVVCRGKWREQFVNKVLPESEFTEDFLWKHFAKEKIIFNDKDSLYELYRSLELLFFKEDILDFADSSSHESGNYQIWRDTMSNYLAQFNISCKV